MILEYSNKDGKIAFSDDDLLYVSKEISFVYDLVYYPDTKESRKIWDAHYILCIFSKEPFYVTIYLGNAESEIDVIEKYNKQITEFRIEHAQILNALQNK